LLGLKPQAKAGATFLTTNKAEGLSMIMIKVISSILIVATVFLNLKHGWEGLHLDAHPEQAKMAADLGLGKPGMTIISILSIGVGIGILFPQSFFIANLLNAVTIVVIMAFSLKTGNYKMALIEIPFLLIPLLLIYLGYPWRK
jgi:hypothetical protein